MSLMPIFSPIVAASGLITDHAVDATNVGSGSSYTFTSKAIGAAGSNRKVAALIVGRPGGGTAFTGVTIQGIAATERIKRVGGGTMAAIYEAMVPTGTTATVVVTWNGSMTSCGLGLAAIYDAAASTTDTGSSAADPLNDTLDIPARGIALGVAIDRGTSTWTWTNLTEGYDEAVEAADNTHTGAIKAFDTAQTGLSITADPSNAAIDPIMVLASWGPTT